MSFKDSIKVSEPNKMERYSLYSDYTTMQKQGFIYMIQLIDKYITQLQEEGELTNNVKINARIKSAESALRNDEMKALDDVFGIEILAGNENALKKIIKKLDENFMCTKEKKHDKTNGYKAVHKSMTLQEANGTNIPLVEIQFKTFAVKENSTSGNATHIEYKNQSKEDIQKMFEDGEFNEHNLPIMYKVDENHKIRILDMNETIKELYPFINMSSIKEKEIQNK